MHHFLTCNQNINYNASLVPISLLVGAQKKTPDCHIFWTYFSRLHQSLDSPRLTPSNHRDNGTPPLPSTKNEEFSPLLTEMIHTTLADQTKIGWDNALKGILAFSWTQIAKYGNQQTGEAERRIQAALNQLYTRNQSMWRGRNEMLHGSSETELSCIYTMESAAIRYYHSRPHLLAACDRHYYCERSLLSILQGSPSTRCRWLRRVRSARAAYLKDGRLQTRITGYFNSKQDETTTASNIHQHPLHPSDIPKTRDDSMSFPNQARPSSRRQQLQRRHATIQSMITRFYPSARPPDLNPDTTHEQPQTFNQIPRI
jgi:hypothetical protein